MPFELFLALRHLRSRQKRRLARVTSLIAILGIAVGVGALIVALALANGFRDEMRDKILRGTAHLTIVRTDGQPMWEYRDLASRVAGVAGVRRAAGTTYDGAVLIGKKTSAYAVLRGIDRADTKVSPVDQPVFSGTENELSVVSGSAKEVFETDGAARDSPPVVLGAELATRVGLEVGDIAQLMGTGTGFSPSNSERNVRVVGIFRSGLFEYDSTWIYLPLEIASALSGVEHSGSLFGNRHAAAVVSVQVENIYEVKKTADAIKHVLGSEYSTVDWQEANRPLFTALALERRIGVVIIGLIVFIAVLNITTTLIMVVVERRRDIAILNAMGANSRSIMSIFVIQGAIVGVVGAVGGLLLGAIAIVMANRYQLISLPAEVYSISNVPLTFHLRDMAFAALAALVLSVVATLYPARAAARLRPAEMLRDTQ
jgi:lipoprotein-releasing system permease protein